MAGIVGYGVSFPYYRIDPKEIHGVWLRNVMETEIARMGLTGRGVLGPDEDPITLGVEAARRALDMAGIEPSKVGALFVGTQTNPYTTKSMASVIGDMLLIGPAVISGDCQFSGKSGTMALQAIWGLVEAGIVDYGLVIAADALSLHIAPANPLEYTAAAGGAAFVVGREGVLAEIDATASFASDTTDYFRLDEERFLYGGGAAMTNSKVGAPTHLSGAAQLLLKKTAKDIDDFSYAAVPQENESSAYRNGGVLGFGKEKVAPGVFAQHIGDCGSAAPFISLARILEKAQNGESILMASYGYGAGSDVFCITRTGVKPKSEPKAGVDELVKRSAFVSYPIALKYERKYTGPSVRMSTFA